MSLLNKSIRRAFPDWPAIPPALWLTGGGSLLCCLALAWDREIWSRPGLAQAYLWPALGLLVLASLALGTQWLWRLVRSCAGPSLLMRVFYTGAAVVVIGVVAGIILLVSIIVFMLTSGLLR